MGSNSMNGTKGRKQNYWLQAGMNDQPTNNVDFHQHQVMNTSYNRVINDTMNSFSQSNMKIRKDPLRSMQIQNNGGASSLSVKVPNGKLKTKSITPNIRAHKSTNQIVPGF